MSDAEKLNLSRARDFIKAFIRDDASKEIFEGALTALGLFADQKEVVKGGIAKAHEYLQEKRSPEILVVDIEGEDLPISKMKELADVVEPGTKVLVMGVKNDVGLFRELSFLGVNDYAVKPLTQDLCIHLLKRLEDPTSGGEKKGRVVLFSGARGGVGTSSFVQIAASKLSQKHFRRVAIVDLDLYFGNLFMRKEGDNELMLSEILSQEDQLDELLVMRTMKQLSDKVFALGGVGDGLSSSMPSPTAFLKLLSVLEQQFHFVFIDAPRYMLPHFMNIMPRVHTSLLFVPPSVVGLRDALRIPRFYGTPWKYIVSQATPDVGLKNHEIMQHLGLHEEPMRIPYLKQMGEYTTFGDFKQIEEMRLPSILEDMVNIISGLALHKKTSMLKRLLGAA